VTVLFALFDARIASQGADFAEVATELFIEENKGFRDAVTDSAGLAAGAAALSEGLDVEQLLASGGERRLQVLLMSDAGEIVFDWFAVDGDGAATGSDPNARDGVLALAGAVNGFCHDNFGESRIESRELDNPSTLLSFSQLADRSIQDQGLRVLSSMLMLSARINFQLADLLTTEGALREHAPDGFFQHAARVGFEKGLGRDFGH
jgi:hypothetical protein